MQPPQRRGAEAGPTLRAAGAWQTPRRWGAPGAAGEGLLGVPGTHTATRLAPRCGRSPGLSRALEMQAEPRGRGGAGAGGARPVGGDAPCPAGAAAAAAGPPRLGSPAPQVASGQHLTSCFVHFLISCRAGQRS